MGKAQRDHYLRNKDAIKARARRHTTLQRKRLGWEARKAKARPCADCGGEYPPWVMDFDHVAGAKVANVADLVRSGCGLQRLRDEIAKCEVVCANCHRERTHARGAAASPIDDAEPLAEQLQIR